MKTILLIFTTFLSVSASAQYGYLDSNFANNGILVDERLVSIENDIALQKDGKIVMGGTSFRLARYNADGTPDYTFGESGIVNKVVSDQIDCFAIAIQENGKIIAAGILSVFTDGNSSDIIIYRYNIDGKIDSSFGTNGKVITNIKSYDYVTDMGLQNDGKIIVSGWNVSEENEPGSIFAVRYQVNGNIDETFAENGIFFKIIEEGILRANAMAISGDGSIFLGATSDESSLSYLITKLNTNGTADASFGTNGESYYAIPNTSTGGLNTLVIQKNGKLIAAGYIIYKNDNQSNLTLIRYNINGQVDETFAGGGVKIITLENNGSEGKASQLDNNDNIIISGRIIDAFPNFDYDAAIFAFKPDGSFDSSFAQNGIQITPVRSTSTYDNILINAKGELIVSGRSNSSELRLNNFLMSQYIGKTNVVKPPQYVKIKKWLHRHGFTWEDKPENNISYYSIERSNNSTAFNEITRIFSRSSSGQHSFEDAAPATGTNYYRVAAISANRSTVYSNIIAIENNTVTIKVYPNPAKNNLQIEGLHSMAATKLSITDLNGNVRMKATANTSYYSWNIAQLPKGNYLIKTESLNIITTNKFVKE